MTAAGRRRALICSAVAARVLLFCAGLAAPAQAAQSGSGSGDVATALSTTPTAPTAPPGWSITVLPGARPGVQLLALKRPPRFAPLRYRVVVLPGSGCTGWAPLAPRYFAALLHAELWVLSKPGVDIQAGAAATCSDEFVRGDTLSSWRDHARAALRAYEADLVQRQSVPQLLLGISEGAELLPQLAPELSSLAALVMLSAAGLDPRETGALQAQRLGQLPAWQALEDAQSSADEAGRVLQGRTLGYWRDLWTWPLAQPLLDAPWPLLRVWGDADALVPRSAYQGYTQRASARAAGFCDLRLAAADHGLQSARGDGIQWLWGRLENWARAPSRDFCAAVTQGGER